MILIYEQLLILTIIIKFVSLGTYMRFAFTILQIIIVVSLIDLYVYKAIRTAFIKSVKTKAFKIISIIYWFITVFSIGIFIIVRLKHNVITDFHTYAVFFDIIGIYLMITVPKIIIIIFHLIEDLVSLCLRIFKKPRLRIITRISIAISIIPFVAVFYGMVYGRYDYEVKTNEIKYSNLPDNFDKFKIVQISDFHLGLLNGNDKELNKIVSIVNSLHPDIIVFTGDLINNLADEVKGTETILSKFKAKYGKYSILGNHDYGDYSLWASNREKAANFNKLVQWHKILGFKLLRNEADSIIINGQKIAIIGVENWGVKPFHKYGDLAKAMNGTENFSFRILFSHDPSHWRNEVTDKTNIDLTLSGHTHGFQFGIGTGKSKWSPIKYKYPEWGGLYNSKKQYLYVNVGIGEIGFPGRVGMRPEITEIILRK